MSMTTPISAVHKPQIHLLGDVDCVDHGRVFDVVVSTDSLFHGSLRLSEAHAHWLSPAHWPEEAESGARFVIVLNSALALTVAGTVARAVASDGDNYRDLKAVRRAELAENAAEEAAVARAFRGTEPMPAVVIWSDDPRTERLGLPSFRH